MPTSFRCNSAILYFSLTKNRFKMTCDFCFRYTVLCLKIICMT